MPAIEIADLACHNDERNPGGSETVVLLHGWPYDPSNWDVVAGEDRGDGQASATSRSPSRRLW